MKYGFVGAGNIAEAIIRGLVFGKKGAGVVRPEEICVYETNAERRRFVREQLRVSTAGTAGELAEVCKVVFLTVKPDVLGDVLSEIKETVITHNPLLIAVVAGKTHAFIEQRLGYPASVALAMPNTNAAVGESMTIICTRNVDAARLEIVKNCFNAIGKVYITTEDKMPVLSALCSCSPAFTYLFIEALAKAAHKNGIDKKNAVSLATQAVLGSAVLVEQSQKHIGEQIDAVCSPGGMTIEGVCALEEYGFQTAVLKAVEAAIAKTKKL